MNARDLWQSHKLGLAASLVRRSTLLANIYYEYAGFTFAIMPEGDDHIAVAVPGQHPAAYKDKHARAARECWINDGRPS